MPQVRSTIRDCGLAIAIIGLILLRMIPGSWLAVTALVQRTATVVSHCEPALIAYTLPAMEGDRAMSKYYCAPDGGQHNVIVTLVDFDVTLGYSIIQGPTLIGTFTDKDSNGYLIVASETLRDNPRP